MRRQLTADELDELFRRIGRNIWHVQYLEDALHSFLVLKVEIKTPGRTTELEAATLLQKHRRATLGTALRTAEQHQVLTHETLESLRHLKEERDWLVHRSMHQAGDSLYTSDGRDAVFARLDAMLSKTQLAKAQVMAELETFCLGHGVSPAVAEQNARAQLAKLRGES